MRTAIGTREHIKVLEEYTCGGLRVEVLEYEKLLGLSHPAMAQQIYFMEKQNVRVRQIALYLNNEKVTIEKGAMSYFQGNLQMVSGVTAGNALGRLVRGAVTGEQMAQPEYTGTGLLVLEPSFKHFLVLELANNESIIVDDGMFYCSQGSVTVKAVAQRRLSAAVAGGETLFQQQLTGPGVIILESVVPMDEIDIIDLNNDTLKVDGNFAVLRSSNLEFTVERSAKTLIGSAVSGEGLVNVYRGTGQVWLAPTIKVYNTLRSAYGLGSSSTESLNMNTSRSKFKKAAIFPDIFLYRNKSKAAHNFPVFLLKPALKNDKTAWDFSSLTALSFFIYCHCLLNLIFFTTGITKFQNPPHQIIIKFITFTLIQMLFHKFCLNFIIIFPAIFLHIITVILI